MLLRTIVVDEMMVKSPVCSVHWLFQTVQNLDRPTLLLEKGSLKSPANYSVLWYQQAAGSIQKNRIQHQKNLKEYICFKKVTKAREQLRHYTASQQGYT